jgi:hypothetical protein
MRSEQRKLLVIGLVRFGAHARFDSVKQDGRSVGTVVALGCLRPRQLSAARPHGKRPASTFFRLGGVTNRATPDGELRD